MNIGDIVQGGILFYSGATVFIAALKDIEIPLYWDNFKNAVSGTSTAIGLGAINTTKIVSVCTGNTMIAASVCENYSFSGYTDWFLPSKDELNLMYLNIKEKLVPNYYWSSSEINEKFAWQQHFQTGTQCKIYKNIIAYIRAIRAF